MRINNKSKRRFLCCNAISIAQAKYYPEMHPNAIYNNDDLIDFFMYKRIESQPDTATLCRFMIDYRFQHKGLGSKAFAHILKGLKIQGVRKVVLMIDNANEIAKKLYVFSGSTLPGKFKMMNTTMKWNCNYIDMEDL